MNDTQEEHFVGKVAQKVLLVKNDQVLITRDSRDTVWELPGERLNKGEDPATGLKREVFEELGVVIQVGQPVYVNQFKHTRDGAYAFVVVYTATLEDDLAAFTVDPVEVADMQWVTENTWNEYEFYPEYAKALKVYFESV